MLGLDLGSTALCDHAQAVVLEVPEAVGAALDELHLAVEALGDAVVLVKRHMRAISSLQLVRVLARAASGTTSSNPSYGRVILPFALLRCLECVLADTKDKVLAASR